jgi:hypothetical protein
VMVDAHPVIAMFCVQIMSPRALHGAVVPVRGTANRSIRVSTSYGALIKRSILIERLLICVT